MSSPVSTAVSDYAKCTIYHTGIEQHVEGIICGDRVYALDRDGLPGSLRDKCWWATDEPWLCGVENGLMQLEVDGKWGYVQADTDKIIIAPVFDYAGPFCGGYAHVAYNLHSENARELLINDTFSLALWFRADCREPGGQHGFINKEGKFVIPCEYDDASDLNTDGRFIVVRDGKCGVVDQDNHTIVDFRWNRALYYGNDVWAGYVAASCDGEGGEWRWALLGKDGEQYYEGLTEKPDLYYFPERSGNLCRARRSRKKYGRMTRSISATLRMINTRAWTIRRLAAARAWSCVPIRLKRPCSRSKTRDVRFIFHRAAIP